MGSMNKYDDVYVHIRGKVIPYQYRNCYVGFGSEYITISATNTINGAAERFPVGTVEKVDTYREEKTE